MNVTGGAARTLAITVLAGACLAASAAAQAPDSDIYTAPLQRSSGMLRLGEPVNVTSRAGYDNQPHFTADGAGIYYTRIDQAGQADIWLYRDGSHSNVTRTAPESEYSATPLPDGTGISVIRVERDSTQRLWRFDADGSNARVIFEDIAPVGYHAWADGSRVAMFILGQPATLQVGDVRTGGANLVASNIGRAIQKVPGRTAISFVQSPPATAGSGEALPPMLLRMLDVESGELSEITVAPAITASGRGRPVTRAAEYHAWLPDGTLITALGSVLYALEAGEWRSFADLSAAGITISRLAVSPDGRQLAFVGERRQSP